MLTKTAEKLAAAIFRDDHDEGGSISIYDYEIQTQT